MNKYAQNLHMVHTDQRSYLPRFDNLLIRKPDQKYNNNVANKQKTTSKEFSMLKKKTMNTNT